MKTYSLKWRLALVAVFLFLSGCAVQHVEPWERDMLAQKKMQMIPCPVENSLDEHIYFSKEASSGGESVGGGGCGCN